jgi:predicted MFS family arabinose efflux permease
MIGIGSVIGRLALGALGPRFGEIRVGAASSALIAVSLFGINLADRQPMLAGLLFAFGAAYGSFNALIGPLVAKVCGRANIGQAVGVLATGLSHLTQYGPCERVGPSGALAFASD